MPFTRIKFILGGSIILAGVIFLIISSTSASAEYFLTIDELIAEGSDALGRNLRVSGAVIGDSIQYDPQTMALTFQVAHVPGDNDFIEEQGGLAYVLHTAVTDPTQARITVIYSGAMPDLLQDEAQAIMTGYLGEDGIFYANELLLKCPTKYEEALPDQADDS